MNSKKLNMSNKGTITSWSDRLTIAKSTDEQEAYKEFISYVNTESVKSNENSKIAKFYENQTIFITGGSGFVGKSVIEKLLRSCPRIKEIIILLRPKRGIDIVTRLRSMLELSLFDAIRDKHCDGQLLTSKLTPILGDIIEPSLGLSTEDRDYVCSRATIVINSAASVRFDEPLPKSTFNNVISVDNLLDVAKKMQKLESFVHISSCYAHCHLPVVKEKYYLPYIDPNQLIKLVKMSSDQPDIEKQLERLLVESKMPNTYTLTKAVGEALLQERSKELSSNASICIIRPSIVCATWREPIKGWVDSLSAATGIFVGLATGSTRFLYADANKNIDVIPVDILANSIICSGWATCNHPDLFPTKSIFNVSNSLSNPINWRQATKHFNYLTKKFPYDDSVRPASSSIISGRYMSTIYNIYDWLDASITQRLCQILNHRVPHFERFKQAHKRYNILGYFTTRQWTFPSTKNRLIHDQMNSIDRELFNINTSSVDWKEYFQNYYVGTKIFVLKDSPNELLASRRRMKLSETVQMIVFYMIAITIFSIMVGISLKKLS